MEYRTKSELGREMVDLISTWVDPRRGVRLLLDSGYMGRTMLRDLPFERVTVFGSLETNAALYRPIPAGQGRSKSHAQASRTPSQEGRAVADADEDAP